MTNQTERENWRVQRNKRNRLIFESNRKLQQKNDVVVDATRDESERIQAQEVLKAREQFERRQAKKEEAKTEEAQIVQEEQFVSEAIADNRLIRRQAIMSSGVAPEQKPEPKINSGSAYLMVGTAFFFDVFQTLLNVIPVIGQILSMFVTGIAWGTFKLWFHIKGVKFSQTKTMIVEIFPVINVIPVWTVSVLLAVAKDRSGGLLSAVPGLKAVVNKL